MYTQHRRYSRCIVRPPRSITLRLRLENFDSQRRSWTRGYVAGKRIRETRFSRNEGIARSWISAKYRRGIPSSCERIADGCRRPTGPVPPSSLHPLASLHPAASCVTSSPTLDPPSLQRLPLLQRYHLHPPSLSPPRSSPLGSTRFCAPLPLFLPSTSTLLNRSRVHSPMFLLNFITHNDNLAFQPSRISRFVNFRISDGRGCACPFPRILFLFATVISSLYSSRRCENAGWVERIGASSRAITRARRDNEYDGEGSSSNRAEAPPNGSPSCDAESFYI